VHLHRLDPCGWLIEDGLHKQAAGRLTVRECIFMPYYESVFIARQDITTAQVDVMAAEFAEIIRQNGGQVTKTESWGLRTLAYKIKKNRKGHYVMFNIDATSAAVQEMERNIRLHEDILRFLTVKVEELEAGPSAILRRDDREGEQRTERFDRSGPSSGSRRDGSGRPPRHNDNNDHEEQRA
jgi:small subunit ribosomal protein S6